MRNNASFILFCNGEGHFSTIPFHFIALFNSNIIIVIHRVRTAPAQGGRPLCPWPRRAPVLTLPSHPWPAFPTRAGTAPTA